MNYSKATLFLTFVVVALGCALAAPLPHGHKVLPLVESAAQSDDPNQDGPPVGTAAPDFTLPDLAGQKLTLSSLHERPVVLGFFCGCDRCHAAAMKIAELQRAGKLKNFVAVVAMDNAAVLGFQHNTGIGGTLLIDPSDRTSELYASDFCLRLWAIARDGKITYKSDIALEGGELTDTLTKIQQASAD